MKFILGLFAGGFIGVFTMALCIASKMGVDLHSELSEEGEK